MHDQKDRERVDFTGEKLLMYCEQEAKVKQFWKSPLLPKKKQMHIYLTCAI